MKRPLFETFKILLNVPRNALIAALLAVATFAASAQTSQYVDQATPHTVGTNVYYGDDLFTAFAKVNTNTISFDARLVTGANNTAIISNQLADATAAFSAISNGVIAANSLAALVSLGFNDQSNTLSLFWATNIPAGRTLNFDSNSITSDGLGNLTAKTVTALSLQGKLLDSATNTGPAGYLPVAGGSGPWTWTAPAVIPDSAGHGGTTLQLKASDTGSNMYLHITSSGLITATNSP